MSSNCRFYANVVAMHKGVTGSCNLVIVSFPNGQKLRFIVDCGLFQENEYEELNSKLPFDPKEIDFALLTHVHVDHVGRFPYMVKQGYENPIYATDSTCKIAKNALYDSVKVLSQMARRRNKASLYSLEDVDKTLSLMVPTDYQEFVKVNEHVKVMFFMNGHVVGSSLILVQISYPVYEKINILFTGDYNNKNMFFTVPEIPKWVKKLPLTIVQESTYGNMDSTDITTCFQENILRTLKKNGTVVVPVFSLGRAQEILYVLKKMQERGMLSKNIPIYLDGNLAINYTFMYRRGNLQEIPEKMRKSFLPENLTFVDAKNRASVVNGFKPKIILTTSGMGSYGPAQTYIPEYISRRNALIQFTGYTAEGTLGNILKTTEKNRLVEVGGLIAIKQADVEYTTEFSAHAKADEMIAFLNQFENLKLVLINHGEPETKRIFAERVVKQVKVNRVGLLGESYFFKIDPYGLVKTVTANYE